MLKTLLQKLCPDGVSFFALEDVFNIRNGYTPSKSNPEFWENGTVPWFRMEDIRENGGILSDSIQKVSPKAVKGKLFPKNSIIMATTATIGVHALVLTESLANQQFTYLFPKEKWLRRLHPRFVYYYCFVLGEWCSKNTNKSGYATVNMGGFRRFQFPVPPLPIQEEIVRVLDKFTLLKAELEAELEARTMQYEHYRDALLDFSPKAGATRPMFMQNLINENCLSDVAYYKLIDLCLKVENIRWSDNESKTYDYIDLSSVDRDNKKIVQTEIIDVMTAPSRAQQIIQTEDIIYGTTRPTLKRYCFVPQEYNGQICSTGYCVLRVDKSMMLPKFLYYLVSTRKFDLHVEMFQRGSAYPAISDIDLKNFEVPVPSLPVQEAIVDILDRFEAIVHDIQDGLPAEIALRQKQYEYYRDKLLTFEPLETETKAA